VLFCRPQPLRGLVLSQPRTALEPEQRMRLGGGDRLAARSAFGLVKTEGTDKLDERPLESRRRDRSLHAGDVGAVDADRPGVGVSRRAASIRSAGMRRKLQ